MSSLVNFYREIEKSKREPKELKCVICKKDILDDSQFINGKYYHNSCIENLQKQNTELKEDIKNLVKIISKNCYELEATEEEFKSLYRWENE